MSDKLLEVKNLKTYFYTDDGVVKSVDDVSFEVKRGKTLGVVGESGCGKSITSLSIMQLVEIPPGKIVDGQIIYEGENLLEKSKDEMRKIRGGEIAMIFQEPMTSLNPVFTVGQQIMEALTLHTDMDKAAAKERAIEMLKLVKIPLPEKRFNEYPHQLSGGMRQRVMIAMALSCNPKLLICDEPTTALDVTIQAQILDLLRDLKDKIDGSIMLITHDLGIIAEMADYVVVMYAGKVIEQGTAKEIFHNPMHPYTIGLQKSKPTLKSDSDMLFNIPGNVPNPVNMPNHCYFKERCDRCVKKCSGDYPGMVQVSPTHYVACHLYEEDQNNG